MSLRAFMFAADALRQEDGVGFHVETEVPARREPTPAENRERNAQAMQNLMGMMAGVQKRR